MDPVLVITHGAYSFLDLAVAVFALLFLFYIGVLVGYMKGRQAGVKAGYEKARTIPIGQFKSLSYSVGEGLDGVIELADDVTITEEPNA